MKMLCKLTLRATTFCLLFFYTPMLVQIAGQPYTYVPFATGVANLSYPQSGAWGDVDHDGDYDVAYSAVIRETYATQPYYINKFIVARNDGHNNFTPTILISENSFDQGRIELVDFNNDNIPEIFAAGRCSRWNLTYQLWEISSAIKIWRYNSGGFGLIYNKTFNGDISDAGCADFDLDGDMDFQFGGRVYINNGSGFDETYFHKSDFPLARWYIKSDKADIDFDGDPDFIEFFTTGMFNLNQANSNSFSRPTIPVPIGVNINTSKNEISLLWNSSTDSDSPEESISYVVRLGNTSGGTQIVSPLADPLTGNIFTSHVGNSGINKNSFTIKSPGFIKGAAYYWSVESIDEVGLCSGFSNEQIFTFAQFANVSAGVDSRVGGSLIPCDLNNDGSLEIVAAACKVLGKFMPDDRVQILNNNFQEIAYPSSTYGYSASVSDFNNDNRLDIFAEQKLLINNGDLTFTDKPGGNDIIDIGWRVPLLQADFDNDGDNDILITSNNKSYIYSNTGTGNYVVYDSLLIYPLSRRSALWGDYDNDNDLDLFLIGTDIYGTKVCCIYQNNQHNFSKVDTEIEPVSNGSADWGDYDNDGYLDILVSGTDNSGAFTTRVYKNTGHGFMRIEGFFMGIGKHTYASDYFPTFSNDAFCKWGDFNNDGFLDIALYGKSNYNLPVSEILINDKGQSFSILNAGFSTNEAGSLVVADLYGNDGALDIAFTGATGHPDNSLMAAYKNLAGNSKLPIAPNNLNFVQNGNDIILNWDINADLSIKRGLSYNLRIGKTPHGTDILSPIADINTGKRFIVERGRAGSNSTWKVSNLPAGIYYWSVQTIDQSFSGGAWAPESTFIVSTVDADFATDTVCYGKTTHFTNKTVTNGETISGWEWNFGDGITSMSENPQHTYANPGNYIAKLISRTNNNSDTVQHNVIVKSIPYPDFSFNLACIGTPTSFSNETNLNGLTINRWLWDFGDEQSSILQNPGLHGYINDGEYNTLLWAFASNGCNSSIQKTVTVAAYPVAEVTTNAPTTFCSGSSVTLSVPNNSDYTYAWYLNGTGITGANVSQYIARQTGNYSVSVTNKTGNCSTHSNQVSVTSQNIPAAPSISASGPVTFCQGGSVTLSVTNTAGYTYQWKRDGGAIGTNLNSLNTTVSGSYSVSITNAAGCRVDAVTPVIVTVNSLPTVPTVSINGERTFCIGKNVQLSVPTNTNYSYQWQQSGISIAGATSNNYTVSASGIYHLKLTDANNCSSITDDVVITTLAVPAVPTISTNGPVQFCDGDSVILSVTSTPGITYQWNLNGGSIGINSCQLTVKNQGTYSLKISNSSGCSVNSSNSPVVTVYPKPVLPTVNISGPSSFCQGNSVELSVMNTAGYTYQWEKNTLAITGATTNAYSAISSGVYTLRIKNTSNCFARTENVNVNVLASPTPPAIIFTGSTSICQDESRMLSVGNTPGHTYHWKLNGGDVGSNSNIYNAVSSGIYDLIVTNSSGCSVNSSNSIAITVKPKPAIPTVNINGATSFCQGSSIDLSVAPTAGCEYQWENNGSAISGATANKFTVNTSGIYTLKITNSDNCDTKSENINVDVLATPLIPTISAASSTSFCQGDSVFLSVNPVPGYIYDWKLNDGTIGAGKNYFTAKASGDYSLTVSNPAGCKADAKNIIKVTVNPKPLSRTISTSGFTTFCQGGRVILSVSPEEGCTYAWRNETGPISGAVSNSFVAELSGLYHVDITNTLGCSNSTSPISVLSKNAPIKPVLSTVNYSQGQCPGENPVKLAVDHQIKGYKYSWSKNGQMLVHDTLPYIEFYEAGNYQLTADLEGCTAVSDLFTAEFPSGLPKPTIYAEGPNLWYLACSDMNAYNYKWYYYDQIIIGADKYYYVANQKLGEYRVSIGNRQGCYTMSEIISIPPGLTAIDDPEPLRSLKIYPNPTTGRIILELHNNILGHLSIEISSQEGRRVFHKVFDKTLEAFKAEIDLGSESSGMYIMLLNQKRYSITRKIVIK